MTPLPSDDGFIRYVIENRWFDDEPQVVDWLRLHDRALAVAAFLGIGTLLASSEHDRMQKAGACAMVFAVFWAGLRLGWW